MGWPRKRPKTSTGEELRELIGDLNVDEAAELVAIMWIGRGDYDAAEFAEAVAEARGRGNRRTAKYLLGFPLARRLAGRGSRSDRRVTPVQ